MTGARSGVGAVDMAMILAAGRGVRMGALSATTPKPLISVAGRTMLDRAFDSLAAGGVRRVVVNVHHLADQVAARARARTDFSVIVSDERAGLLDTGGGVNKALRHFGDRPFLTRNGDCFWIEPAASAVGSLIRSWRADGMSALLLLARRERAFGHDGPGDFFLGEDGRLARRGDARRAPFVYAGAQIIAPHLFDDAPDGPFSLNLCWDRAAALGALHGVILEADWYHVGDPDALRLAEDRLGASIP